ncbi:MAG: 5-formyltetrahydrofolate cyclo-ligase [Deltaproteobacteria bacterium]|nr:5-formyltetrahydrofolate cyclo-ligase [Deltaproteobacteria bacterium]
MADTKAEWRERLQRARRSIDMGTRREAGADVVARLARLREFIGARSVLLYASLGAELDVHALARAAWHARKDVYRPASAEPPPTWVRDDSSPSEPSIEEPLAAGARDVPEGAASSERFALPILLIAPGVGFDAFGRRLGRGRGYYDRAIAALRDAGDVVIVGVAYDAQVVDALPQDPWDQRVDLVVTERRVLVPKPSPHCDPSRPAREEVRDDR